MLSHLCWTKVIPLSVGHCTFAWSALALSTNASQTFLVDEGTIVEQVAAVVLLVVREPLAAVEE